MFIKKIVIYEITNALYYTDASMKGFIELLLDNNKLIAKLFEAKNIFQDNYVIDFYNERLYKENKSTILSSNFEDKSLNTFCTLKETIDIRKKIKEHCVRVRISQPEYKNINTIIDKNTPFYIVMIIGLFFYFIIILKNCS